MPRNKLKISVGQMDRFTSNVGYNIKENTISGSELLRLDVNENEDEISSESEDDPSPIIVAEVVITSDQVTENPDDIPPVPEILLDVVTNANKDNDYINSEYQYEDHTDRVNESVIESLNDHTYSDLDNVSKLINWSKQDDHDYSVLSSGEHEILQGQSLNIDQAD